jgi:predicted dehydrogenase
MVWIPSWVETARKHGWSVLAEAVAMIRRALLIGYGSIGAKRARILRDFGWKVTIWEPDALRRLAARADGFTDVEPGGDATRVNGTEVAFICSPPIYHADHAIACLQVAHVFIEKPIAHTLQDAHKIMEAHDLSDKHLMVGCNYRFSSAIKIMPERLQALEITMAYHLPTDRPGWRENYVNDPAQGGVVLDSGVHAIDLARHLAGPIKKIHNAGGSRPPTGDVEHHACIWIEHQNGIRTTINLDWTTKKAVREVWFHTKTGHRWTSNLYDGTDAMFQREMRAFLRCVTRVPISSSPPNPPEEATETLRWCIEARNMVRDGLARVAL